MQAVRGYWADLDARFGRPALYAIVVMTFCNSVIDGNTLFFAQYYLKRDLLLSPAEAQGMLIPLRGAWALKPLYGTVTDAFPLFGYKYKPYVGAMGAVGVCATTMLWLLPPTKPLATVCFLGIGICTGWVDVLCNAVIVSACRAEGAGGRKGAADLQAVSIAVFYFGSLVGTALAGVMFQLSGSARQCFGLSGVFPVALLLLPRSLAEHMAPAGSRRPTGSRLRSVRGAYNALRPGSTGGGAVLQAALFVALSAAIVPSIDQSTFAFYVDTDRTDSATSPVSCDWVAKQVQTNSTCVNDAALGSLGSQAAVACPAACNQCDITRRGCIEFSPSFLAVLGVLRCLSSIVAAAVFARYLAKLPLRRALLRIQIVLPFAAMCDFVLVNRWNTAVGLDDHLFGGIDTVVYTVVSAMKTISIYTLVTAVCPQQVVSYQIPCELTFLHSTVWNCNSLQRVLCWTGGDTLLLDHGIHVPRGRCLANNGQVFCRISRHLR